MLKDFLGFQFYENFHKNRRFLTVFRYPLVEDHLYRYTWVSKKVKGKILDVACGSGWGTLHLIKNTKLKAQSCVGIDINPVAFEHAHSLNKEYTEFKKFNLLSPDENLGKFNSIVAFEIIEHFNSKDVKLFLNTLKDFCEKYTSVFISTPNKNAFSPLGYKWLPYHPVEYNLEELKNLLKKNGFEVEEVYYQRPLFKPLHKLAAYLILFPILFFNNKTLENKIVKYLFALFNRVELFLGTFYFSKIQKESRNKLVYPKYFILKVRCNS